MALAWNIAKVLYSWYMFLLGLNLTYYFLWKVFCTQYQTPFENHFVAKLHWSGVGRDSCLLWLSIDYSHLLFPYFLHTSRKMSAKFFCPYFAWASALLTTTDKEEYYTWTLPDLLLQLYIRGLSKSRIHWSDRTLLCRYPEIITLKIKIPTIFWLTKITWSFHCQLKHCSAL